MKVWLVLVAIFTFVISIFSVITIFIFSYIETPKNTMPSTTPVAVQTPVSVAPTQTYIPQPITTEIPNAPTESSEQPLLLNNPWAHVEMHENSQGERFEVINITRDDGDLVSYKNNTVETDKDYIYYTYLGYHPDRHVHLLKYKKKEKKGHIIVDAQKAYAFTTSGTLFFIPDSNLIFVQDDTMLSIFKQNKDRKYVALWHEVLLEEDQVTSIAHEDEQLILTHQENNNSYTTRLDISALQEQ